MMSSVTAENMEQLEAYLSSGKHPSVIIGFNLTSDAFFTMAAHWHDRGVKIEKGDHYFIATQESDFIPQCG
ncbi:hypothetical protein [Pantoea sp.]|uniref:hypothetical protein n=1 Tax=Pantoea sp. TaxID=69393 RepID=UPI0031E00A65